jgi:hypothetical protein
MNTFFIMFGTYFIIPHGRGDDISGWIARSDAQRMVGPLRKRRDKAGRQKRLAPKGLHEICPLAALRFLASYVQYDLRRAPCI